MFRSIRAECSYIWMKLYNKIWIKKIGINVWCTDVTALLCHPVIVISISYPLTQWCRDKMTAIIQFKWIFLNENVWISIEVSLKFVPQGPINNIPALAQIMAWRRPGDKPLSDPIMVNLLTHICVTRPQWVKMGIKFVASRISKRHFS